jgi:hypothetical protein
MDQGHMRDVPHTKQGIYAVTPSGVFLASTSAVDGPGMARMLRQALDKWKTLSKQERLLTDDPSKSVIQRWENNYPADGLVLKVYSRDLPRSEPQSNDWTGQAWNLDFAWFRKDEMTSLLPKDLTKGQSTAWPEALARRVAKLHLIDNVRGQTEGYEDANVIEASIKTEVTKVAKGLVTLRFEGSTKVSSTGKWDPSNGRGVGTKILGNATFDPQKGKFTAFEILAVGTRWGMQGHNFRERDLKENPIGFVLTLASDKPQERVPPAMIWRYGWRP